MSLPPLSDDEVADFALSMTPVERAVIQHFAKGRAWQYRVVAEKAGVSYSEVQSLGRKLQRERLAHISVIPYDGCRLFLNHRGESVKHAVAVLTRIESKRAQP